MEYLGIYHFLLKSDDQKCNLHINEDKHPPPKKNTHTHTHTHMHAYILRNYIFHSFIIEASHPFFLLTGIQKPDYHTNVILKRKA
jgi:hypothetical protein